MMVIYIAGIISIPKELLEAAKMDGGDDFCFDPPHRCTARDASGDRLFVFDDFELF